MDAEECKQPNLEPKDRDWIPQLMGLIFDFLVKNMWVPPHLGNLIGHIVLFFLAWYGIVYALRFVICLLMPFFVVLSAVFVVRCLRLFESKDLIEMLWQAVCIVTDLILALWGTILDNIIQYMQ